MQLIPNKAMHGIFFCKTICKVILMLVDAFDQVRRDTCLQSAITLAAKNINIKALHMFLFLDSR